MSFHLVKKLKEERLAELLTAKLLSFFCVMSVVLDNTAYISLNESVRIKVARVTVNN